MADLHIQSFPGNWDEIEDYEDFSPEVRDFLWQAVGDEDWSALTTLLVAGQYIEEGDYVRKARLLREAKPGGDVERLWVRVTRG